MRMVLVIPMMMVACGENPADHTPDAVVTPAAPATPEADVAPAEGQVALGGHIHFTGSNVRSSHTCRFDKWAGTMTPGASGAVEEMALEFTAEIESVFCDWETEHMQFWENAVRGSSALQAGLRQRLLDVVLLARGSGRLCFRLVRHQRCL